MKFILPLILPVLLGASHSHASEPSVNAVPLKYGAQYEGKRQDESMKKFRENRLGQFLVWGLYSIPGGEWNGKVYRGAAEFLPKMANVPKEEWKKLMEQFNPVDFDARQWAAMARKTGVKYVTITTKHHEGFCLWPSKYTDFTVANTPYKKDIIGPLVEACQAEEIDVYLYFSVLEWYHPDWRYSVKTEEDRKAMERFLEYSTNQLKELATRYPTVKGFWFDGTWDQSVKSNGKWSYDTEMMLKKMIPGCIVNSRLRADEKGARHFDSNKKLMGDYESGYERRLPDPVIDADKMAKIDWEACMTIPENQWGYHKDWSLSYVKSPPEVLEWITHTASMGGNMLVNFGPMGNGDFRPEEKALAEYIGKWMQNNGEAIYGCGATGWKKQDWGYYTKKEGGKTGKDKVYMIVFNKPLSRILKVQCPKGVYLQKASFLKGDQSSSSFRIKEMTAQQYGIVLEEETPDQPFVIILETSSDKKESGDYKKALT